MYFVLFGNIFRVLALQNLLLCFRQHWTAGQSSMAFKGLLVLITLHSLLGRIAKAFLSRQCSPGRTEQFAKVSSTKRYVWYREMALRVLMGRKFFEGKVTKVPIYSVGLLLH